MVTIQNSTRVELTFRCSHQTFTIMQLLYGSEVNGKDYTGIFSKDGKLLLGVVTLIMSLKQLRDTTIEEETLGVLPIPLGMQTRTAVCYLMVGPR